MKRIASGSQVASIPTFPADSGTPGYFADAATTPSATPTEITPKWVTAVQEAICQTIEDSGDALSDTMSQFKDIVAGVHGIKAHATGLTTVSTPKKRAIIASTNCTAGSTNGATVVIASVDSSATEDLCAVIAGDTCSNDGLNAVIAGGSANSISSGGTGAFIGGGSTNTAQSDSAAVIGSDNCDATADRAAIVGCNNTDNIGTECLTAACEASRIATGVTNAALLASVNTELGTAECVAGGYAASAPTYDGTDQNLKWKIDSSVGTIEALSTITGSTDPNSDFAEMFPNASVGVLPDGTLLARQGRKVRPAVPGDRVFGVVSAAPGILLGAGSLGYARRFAVDDFGRVQTEEVEFVAFALASEGAESPVLWRGAARACPHPIPNDARRWTVRLAVDATDYDPARKNVPRTARPDEWTAVALVGQVRVRIGPDVEDGDYLTPGADGCAVGTLARPDGRPVEVMEITTPYDPAKGYGVALCLVG